MKQSGICASIAIFLPLFFSFSTYAQEGSLRFPESRSYSPGQVWLEWTAAERIVFVRGFIVGHGDGYQSGCRNAETGRTTSKKAEDRSESCSQKRHLFRKQASFYEQFITDFFSRYTMDRNVPVRILLLQADEKTPDEVHQWLAKKSD